MIRYVLDTSVVVKWFSESDEDDLKASLNLRHQILERKCSIVVPDLLFYEIANALRYNPSFTEDDIKKAVNTLFDMDFDVKNIDPVAMELAIEIAVRNDVTIYDACFLALSELEKISFITADYKFLKNIRGFNNIMRLSVLA
ncbi:type II toxin-antitoxin system VapC family toxin [bacterium]|nr:type II toxin-antitoxin system VapC family toxin [bacterium]